MKGRSCLYNRIITALLSAVMLCLLVPVKSVRAAESLYSDVFFEDFEKYPDETEHFTLPYDSNHASFSEKSVIGTAGSVDSISGDRSLRLIKGNFRFGGLDIQENKIVIGASFKVERDYEGVFGIRIETQDALTETVLLGQGTFDIKRDTVYSLTVSVSRGSRNGSVEISGIGKTDIVFPEEVYMVCGIVFYSEREEIEIIPEESDDISPLEPDETGETDPGRKSEPEYKEYSVLDSAISIDDVSAAVMGKTYAQQYSSQEIGPVTNPQIANNSKKSADVYVNSTKIGMSKTYVTDSTVYISAEQFFKSIDVPYTYEKDSKILTVRNDNVQASVQIPGTSVNINGKNVELAYPVRMIDSVIMISPGFINEVFNASVWWDKDARILVITTGSFKTDNRLRTIGGKLFLNGRPFYAIGAETTELFERVMSTIVHDPRYPSEDDQIGIVSDTLRRLHDVGFGYIRVRLSCGTLSNIMYDDVSLGKYLEAADKLFELCDSYDLKVCVCLDLISDSFVTKVQTQKHGWINGNETVVELVSDRDSGSRVIIQRYLEKIISRYKGRDTVLMYELADSANEAADCGAQNKTVAYSLGQLGLFYADCRAYISEIDDAIVIAGGDSAIRPNQWNLYKNVLNGTSSEAAADTLEERLYALYTLSEGLSIIGSDGYNFGSDLSDNYYMSDDGRTVNTFSGLSSQALKLGKSLYLTNVSTDTVNAITYLTSLIDAGIQLSFWKFPEFTGNTAETSGTLIDEVAFASGTLESAKAINPVADENTNTVWGDTEFNVFDPSSVITGAAAAKEESFTQALIRAGILSAILLACACAVLLYFRNKKVR